MWSSIGGTTYSPRMWGCTAHAPEGVEARAVFPTHVGVNRSTVQHITTSASIPQVCGGEALHQILEMMKKRGINVTFKP
jgi:hypothetical protein